MLQPVGCISALPSTLKCPAFSFLLLLVEFLPFLMIPSLPFHFSLPQHLQSAQQARHRVLHTIFFGRNRTWYKLTQPENLMEGREAPKTVGGMNYPALCKSITQRPPQQVHVYLTKICPCTCPCSFTGTAKAQLLPDPITLPGTSEPVLRCGGAALILLLVQLIPNRRCTGDSHLPCLPLLAPPVPVSGRAGGACSESLNLPGHWTVPSGALITRTEFH